MQNSAQSPAPARSLRGRAARSVMSTGAVIVIALGSTLLSSGCASRSHRPPSSVSLVTGRRAAPLPTAQLASAAAAAERFAHDYVPTVYLRRPPTPGVTTSVRRSLLIAAARVPRSRRGRHPHLAGLNLRLAADGRVESDLRIVDGRSPSFSIGFTLTHGPAGWRVTSISTPG
jgi:hypothetical protein